MIHFESALFYLFSTLLIAFSLFVVCTKRPIYAVLSLASAIICLSGLFTLLGAYFVAMIQVLIYAGAILVLFLFVIMLLGIETKEKQKSKSVLQKIFATLLAVSFLLEFLVILIKSPNLKLAGENIIGTVEAVGHVLFSEYLLPFELISIILLIGALGVINLIQKEEKSS